MIRISGAYKFVIGNIQQVAHSLNHPCHFVHELLRCLPCLLRLQLNLLTMFVRSRLEKHFIAFLPLKTGDTVSQHNLIIISNVRLS